MTISMTYRQRLLGWSYLAFSLFVLPSLLALIPLSAAVVNIAYFCINFLCTAAIFHRFLWYSLKDAYARRWLCLRTAVYGFALYYGAMLLIGWLILLISPGFSNINDNAIASMTQEQGTLMTLCTVFFVPVFEETMHRGLLFGSLRSKSRLLAYCTSTLMFAAIHVVGYIGAADTLTLALCYVQYLPAGLALAWAYEKADNIFAPILIHMTVNQIGLAILR